MVLMIDAAKVSKICDGCALFLLKFVFFLAHFTTTLDMFFTFGHLQTSLHAAHLIRTFFPSLMYTPFRVGGDERRWPERVCQEEIVESERGAAMEVASNSSILAKYLSQPAAMYASRVPAGM